MSMKWISTLLLLQFCSYFHSGSCGKVLVWPMEYSPWLVMKNILEELIQRGHEVTVLIPSSFIFVDGSAPSGIKFETFATSTSEEQMKNLYNEMITMWMDILPINTCLEYFPVAENILMKYSSVWENVCKDVVSNKKLMSKLQESKFDVLLADPIAPCGELVAELLKLPFVYSLRFSPGFQVEKVAGGLPLPPSYVPVMLSGLSGQMTFIERVKNMICMLYFDFWFETFNEKNWNKMYSEILGKPTTLYETMRKADMWLIRSYWDMEFPRPTLPNVEFVGGLQCKPPKPLPKEMENFVQSSGEHGIVLFSLGSMISTMTEAMANAIASDLAQIPQKVGKVLNGKGHPKTRAFITHGGASGVYEAICQGIPMVGIPLFAEQHDNIAQMEAKGVAVKLEFKSITNKVVLNALKTVIQNAT
ncbi:UDP-glucuronosyltransferase 2B17-like [Octodon degus]|uniref:glucuronosyltransferase n=1 Tax=Octodon degus TaxID=10160 RepID=A0A6P6DX51_OCTDE|nr:UDP-glucuronosyltransferase 2B17-like [Octodon degus]